MTFQEFQRVNQLRCSEAFHNHGAKGWPLEMWSLALAGEAGELCNLVKKIRRGDYLLTEKREAVLKELADVITYADLAITHLDGDTGEEIQAKFEEVSQRTHWRRPTPGKIYFAAAFTQNERLRGLRADIDRRYGWKVISRWLEFEFTTPEDAETARIDLEDLAASDSLVLFTDVPSTRGGYQVELGFAIASGKRIYLIGRPENNFQAMPCIQKFETFEAWCEEMEAEAR